MKDIIQSCLLIINNYKLNIIGLCGSEVKGIALSSNYGLIFIIDSTQTKNLNLANAKLYSALKDGTSSAAIITKKTFDKQFIKLSDLVKNRYENNPEKALKSAKQCWDKNKPPANNDSSPPPTYSV